MKSFVMNAHVFGQPDKREAFPFVLDYGRVAPVATLLRLSGPLAVIRRVRPVIVNALDRMFRGWLLSHVGIEALKRTDPVIANFDASAAVPCVGGIVLVQAAFFHAAPRLVFRCRPLCICVAVDNNAALQAAAAFGAYIERVFNYGRRLSALAKTYPARASVGFWSQLNYSEASECSPC